MLRDSSIPLREDQYAVAGIVNAWRRDYTGVRCLEQHRVVYELQPYWRNVIAAGGWAQYCVDTVWREGRTSVAVCANPYYPSYIRGLASILGLDTILTVKSSDRNWVREFLVDRGVRYCETRPFLDGRTPFNLDDPTLEIATEIKLSGNDMEIKRSTLRERLPEPLKPSRDLIKLPGHIFIRTYSR